MSDAVLADRNDPLAGLTAEQIARWEDLLAYVTDPRAPAADGPRRHPGPALAPARPRRHRRGRVLDLRAQPPQPPAAGRLRAALPRRAGPRAQRLRHRQAAQGALPARAADARRGLAPRLLSLVLLARRDHPPRQRRPARGVLDRLGHRAQTPGGRVPGRCGGGSRRTPRRARRRAPRPADDRRAAALRRRRRLELAYLAAVAAPTRPPTCASAPSWRSKPTGPCATPPSSCPTRRRCSCGWRHATPGCSRPATAATVAAWPPAAITAAPGAMTVAPGAMTAATPTPRR